LFEKEFGFVATFVPVSSSLGYLWPASFLIECKRRNIIFRRHFFAFVFTNLKPLTAMKKVNLITTMLLLAFMQAISVRLVAQSYYSPEKSDHGYWQVHTDYKTKNTIVRFFDADHQPMYQETMSRKYIKLTKRNVRKFDELLSKLMSKNMLKSGIEAHDIVADSRIGFHDTYKAEPPAEFKTIVSDPKMAAHNVYVTGQGKIKLILKNPLEEFYQVTIDDDQMRTIYTEQIKASSYGRWFDVSKLPEGTYSINIYNAHKKLNYKLTIDDYLGYKLEDLD
jgi:hypothetical protein